MTWREERRLLNRWLEKKAPSSAEAKHITGQKKRTLTKRKKVESVRTWRRRHPTQYRSQLRAAKRKRAESRKQQGLRDGRLTRTLDALLRNFLR